MKCVTTCTICCAHLAIIIVEPAWKKEHTYYQPDIPLRNQDNNL